MPELPMLASWAYADMALVYYSIAALYAFARYCLTKSGVWLVLMAVMSGLAMSVKYTSFVVPLSCGLLLLFDRPILRSLRTAIQFGSVALLIALPYYARNAILMGNPVYPFAFGGRFWDPFLAGWYSDSGTGIGWNAIQILLLPINTLLGYRDANFLDGRMGPLFLILAPFTLWILLSRLRRDTAEGVSLLAIGVFSLLSFTAWTLGVINSSALWQARLLFPALIPFAIPSALAWDSLHTFNTPGLRISFIFNFLAALVIVLTMIDNTIFVLQRNPLAVATGAQTREKYIERVNPSYAALLALMEELPGDARVYSLFEPRTYGLPRSTQPDAIVSNFAHDVFLYKTPEAILQHWKSEHYTHILVYERGLDFLRENASYKFPPATQNLLQETLAQLTLTGQTPDRVYSVYEVP
ncbi:MAG: glycosyltransferase family 39 protein [Bacteroidota bacterium]